MGSPVTRIRFQLGPIPPDVRTLLESATADDSSAGAFQRDIASALRRSSFTVVPEFTLRRVTPTRDGRIDLYATRPGSPSLWLELDRTNPRARSLVKLRLAVERFGGSAAVLCRY